MKWVHKYFKRINVLVLTIESSCECIGGMVPDGLEGVHAVLVIVNINADQGAKDLLFEDPVLGGGGLHNGRLYEEAHAIVIASAGHDAAVWARLGVLNVSRKSLERLLVDHGGHERVGLGGGAHLEGLLGLHQPLLDLAPQGLGYVHP